MAKKGNFSSGQILYSVLFFALAVLLGILEGRIGVQLGFMELSVLLCGFICGPVCGMVVGAVSPFLYAYLFYLPVFHASNFALAFKLAAFAFVGGLLFKKLNKNIFMYLVATVAALVSGKLLWSALTIIFMFFGWLTENISFDYFWYATVVSRLIPIAVQLIAVPLTVHIFKKNHLIFF